jgi:hypothetical protein
MARGNCTFKERDVRAAVKAVEAAGRTVQRVVIDREGQIVIDLTASEPQKPIDDLDAELAEFEAEHGEG